MTTPDDPLLSAAAFTAEYERRKRAGDQDAATAWLEIARASIQLERITGEPSAETMEGLAFCTRNDAEAIDLYRQLLQRASRVDRPRYNHRLLLAERLIGAGDLSDARRELMLARAEAVQCGDRDATARADAALTRAAL